VKLTYIKFYKILYNLGADTMSESRKKLQNKKQPKSSFITWGFEMEGILLICLTRFAENSLNNDNKCTIC